MRLGSFWGLTAPMFVLAFKNREEPIPIFRMMARYDNAGVMHSLQKELCYLTRLQRLKTYSCTVNTMELAGDDLWVGNRLSMAGEYSEVFREEVLQRTVIKCYEREQRSQYVELENLSDTVNQVLANWTGKVSEISKAVSCVVKSLQESDNSDISEWIRGANVGLESSIVDTVMVNGGLHTLTDDEKAVVWYFTDRLDDINYWIEQLRYDSPSTQEVWGIPFFSLVRKKPESIRYAVLNQFEQIKSMNSAKILTDCIERVRDGLDDLRKYYSQFVCTKDSYNETEDPIDYGSKECEDFFRRLSTRGFRLKDVAVGDRELLFLLYNACSRLDSKYLAKELRVSSRDWNKFGEELGAIGVCGINQCQLELFGEAVLNTILSLDKIFVEQEKIDSVVDILNNDIEALLDTIMPVGEVLY